MTSILMPSILMTSILMTSILMTPILMITNLMTSILMTLILISTPMTSNSIYLISMSSISMTSLLNTLKMTLFDRSNWLVRCKNRYFFTNEMLMLKWWSYSPDTSLNYLLVSSTALLGPKNKPSPTSAWAATLGSRATSGRTSLRMVCEKYCKTMSFHWIVC